MASKIQFAEDGFLFYCPGCRTIHAVNTIEGQRPYWDFNGDSERPTVSPSYLLSIPASGGYPAIRCHLYIRDGQIQYLGDSLHHLSSQTVEMIDWSEWER